MDTAIVQANDASDFAEQYDALVAHFDAREDASRVLSILCGGEVSTEAVDRIVALLCALAMRPSLRVSLTDSHTTWYSLGSDGRTYRVTPA